MKNILLISQGRKKLSFPLSILTWREVLKGQHCGMKYRLLNHFLNPRNYHILFKKQSMVLQIAIFNLVMIPNSLIMLKFY